MLVFVEDVAASGGYMIACAGDEIICRSVLDRRLDRRGRRHLRFSGVDQEDRRRAAALYRRASTRRCSIRSCRKIPMTSARLKALQREIHAIFITLVEGEPRCAAEGRRGRVVLRRILGRRKIRRRWASADTIGDIRSALRARYGEKVQTPVIAPASRHVVRAAGPADRRGGRAGCLRRYRRDCRMN